MYKFGEDTFDKVSGTQELQELSLTNFMAALGYEPVYNHSIGICAFSQPRFERTGEKRVSVLRAIKLHNDLAENTFEEAGFHVHANMNFQEFISYDTNADALINLFAGTTKIVKRLKLSFSKKTGISVQSDKIEFMTKRDFAHYRKFIGV